MSAADLDLYLDLLKRTLTGMVYEDPPIPAGVGERSPYYDADTRINGTDWPSRAPTMVGLARLDHLQWCVEQVLDDGIPGDLLEAGVWRGGACILMRGVLKARGVASRTVWVADSFKGLPAGAAREGFGGDEQDELIVPLEEVRHNFSLYGLLDEQVRFLPGWFCDTLPAAPVTQLAVLRMDGDLHASTTDTLAHLYPKLSPGGFAIIDDWRLPARRAAEEYRAAHGITEPVHPIENSVYAGEAVSVFWRKGCQ